MLKITQLTALFFFLFFSIVSQAQDKTIDSLKIVLQNPKLHDTTRVSIISEVMENHYNSYDKNYFYLNKMIGDIVLKNYKNKNTTALHEKYTILLASYYSKVATEYRYKEGESDKQYAYYDKAIALLKSVKVYDEMHAVFLVKASAYFADKKDEKAIPLAFTALKFFEKNKEDYPLQVAFTLNLLSKAHARQEEFEKALEYSTKAINYYDIAYKQEPTNHVLYLKAGGYNSIASYYNGLKKYKESIVYSNKAAEIAEKIGAHTATGIALARAAEGYAELSNYDQAEKLYKEILAMKTPDTEIDDVSFIHAMIGLGDVYFKKGDFVNAGIYAEKAFTESKKTTNVTLQRNAADLVYGVCMENKNCERALEMYQFVQEIENSGQLEASRNALAEQQLKYDFEKKELKLKLDSEKKNAVKNNWLIGLSGVMLLLLLGVFFYYRNNKQKQAIAGLEKNQIKQKLLITQMNPHFIFNSIDNIQGLIYDKKEMDAVNYLTKFSKLTRQILENSNENYISLSEEVEMTRNYLAIQQLLYDNKFEFNIAVEDDIDQEIIFLPPMLTQPFVENAIKHGISNTENGRIDIRFYLNEGKLFFEVSDNGKGFDASKRTDNHKSLAMTITKERLVNYTKNQDFVVQTDNIKDSNENVVGAKVSFEIPYIYEN